MPGERHRLRGAAEVSGSPESVADSSAIPLPSPSAAVTAPDQCQSQPRAPPDSSEA